MPRNPVLLVGLHAHVYYARIRYPTCRPISLIILFDPLSGGSLYAYTIRADVYDQDYAQDMCHKSYYNIIIIITFFRLVRIWRGGERSAYKYFTRIIVFPAARRINLSTSVRNYCDGTLTFLDKCLKWKLDSRQMHARQRRRLRRRRLRVHY